MAGAESPCLQENAMDNRMKLYQHIVLSGGCTMIPGLPARLERDLRRLYLTNVLQVSLLILNFAYALHYLHLWGGGPQKCMLLPLLSQNPAEDIGLLDFFWGV